MVLINITGYAGESVLVDSVVLYAAGDVNLGHWLTGILDSKGNAYPFKNVRQIFKTSDVFFVNLETPFTSGGEAVKKEFNFRAHPSHVNALKEGGINIVSLANNHIMDYGEEGLFSTIDVLNRSGISYTGAGKNNSEAYRAAKTEIKGKKFALFAYSMTFPTEFFAQKNKSGTAYPHEKTLRDSIGYYETQNYFVVISFHWGEELTKYPKDYQVAMAHKVIDYGASLVLGHHPHVVQGVEVYKNKPVFYSLGNFVFASYSPNAKESVILSARIFGNNKLTVKLIPINVDNFEVQFQPRILKGERRQKMIENIRNLSQELNSGRTVIDADGNIILLN